MVISNSYVSLPEGNPQGQAVRVTVSPPKKSTNLAYPDLRNPGAELEPANSLGHRRAVVSATSLQWSCLHPGVIAMLDVFLGAKTC